MLHSLTMPAQGVSIPSQERLQNGPLFSLLRPFRYYPGIGLRLALADWRSSAALCLPEIDRRGCALRSIVAPSFPLAQAESHEVPTRQKVAQAMVPCSVDVGARLFLRRSGTEEF